MPLRSTVAVFAKLPEPSHVKTRLVGVLSPRQAAEVHRACLEDTLRLVDSLPGCDKRLLLAPCTGVREELLPRGLLHAGWRIELQRGRDLGERLESAFAILLHAGAPKVIVVGTDTPWMGRERIALALTWLDSVDVVLGPSRDGGYYLIGARRLVPQIFRSIPWSTSQVLPLTRQALARAQTSHRLLPSDFDLDRPADLRRAAESLREADARAESLARWIAGWEAAKRSSRRREPAHRSRSQRLGRA